MTIDPAIKLQLAIERGGHGDIAEYGECDSCQHFAINLITIWQLQRICPFCYHLLVAQCEPLPNGDSFAGPTDAADIIDRYHEYVDIEKSQLKNEYMYGE